MSYYNEKQKFKTSDEVYIRPIYEGSMIHFTSDVICYIEGSYGQLCGGDDFKSYGTSVASWYDEDQLMLTNGRSLEECREACKDYFDMSYSEMSKDRKEAIDHQVLAFFTT